MANAKQSEEVQVLHFFETAPIEKAEAVFNIVCEKMRERVPNRSVMPRKRSKKTDDTASRSGERQEQDASTRTGHE